MDSIAQYAKEAFEPKLGRPLTESEAAEFAMHLRRFAAFLIDCSKDDALMTRLGLRKDATGRVAPRAVDNTTGTDRNPQETRLSVLTGPPTAPSRNTLHRESSAYTSQSECKQAPLPLPRPQLPTETVTVQKK